MAKKGSFDKELIETLFAEFCEKRRTHIADAFLNEWLVKLQNRACGDLHVHRIDELSGFAEGRRRIEAQTPRCVGIEDLRPDQRIALFPYHYSVKDALVQYVTDLRGKVVEGKAEALRVNLGKRGFIWLMLNEKGVRLEFKKSVREDVRNLVREALGLAKGKDLLYAAGTAALPVGLTEALSRGAEVARVQAERLDASKRKQREAQREARILAFEARWNEDYGGKTLMYWKKALIHWKEHHQPERGDAGALRPDRAGSRRSVYPF